MTTAITFVAKIIHAGYRIYAKKWRFFAVFGIMFAVSVGFLSKYDLLPEASSHVAEASTSKVEMVALKETPMVNKAPAAVFEAVVPVQAPAKPSALVPAKSEAPLSIVIPSISLSATIANPTSTNIDILNKALLSGAAHYPTSAVPGENGNVIIFGHSSYLPVVHNQAYKTFNDIQKLNNGDSIVIRTADKEYLYMVSSVASESADSNAGIPLQVDSPRLTLATCDVFGKKSDRFIVTAVLVESRALSTP